MWFTTFSVNAAEHCISGKHAVICTRVSRNTWEFRLRPERKSHPSPSSVLDHSTETCHPISLNDFSVLSSSSSTLELLIRESLLISKFKPSLNENICSVPFSLS